MRRLRGNGGLRGAATVVTRMKEKRLPDARRPRRRRRRVFLLLCRQVSTEVVEVAAVTVAVFVSGRHIVASIPQYARAPSARWRGRQTRNPPRRNRLIFFFLQYLRRSSRRFYRFILSFFFFFFSIPVFHCTLHWPRNV